MRQSESLLLLPLSVVCTESSRFFGMMAAFAAIAVLASDFKAATMESCLLADPRTGKSSGWNSDASSAEL